MLVTGYKVGGGNTSPHLIDFPSKSISYLSANVLLRIKSKDGLRRPLRDCEQIPGADGASRPFLYVYYTHDLHIFFQKGVDKCVKRVYNVCISRKEKSP